MNSSIKSSIGTKITVSAINFILIAVSAKYLGAKGRGEIAFFITILATIQLFTEIINGPTIVYLSTRLSIRKKLILSFLWAFLISAIAFVFFELNNFQNSGWLSICSLQFSMTTICLMILQGNNKINLYNRLLILQSLSLISMFLILVFFINKEYHSFIYAFFISWNIPFLISIFFILKLSKDNRFFKENFKETFIKMFQKGIESQSGNIISFLNYRLLFYIIAFQNTDKASLGFVSTAFAIVESILMISNGLGTIQYPSISNNTEIDHAKKITLEYLAISFWLSFIGLFIINSIPANFYSLLFGKDFNDIKKILLILSPGILFLNLQNTLCFYFNGLGLYSINTKGSITGLVAFMVLASIGYQWGITGLCISVSASYIILFTYMLYRFLIHSATPLKDFFLYLCQPKKMLLKVIKDF